MTVSKGTFSKGRLTAGLSAAAFGIALLALPGTALAQQDDHHHDGGGNGGGGAQHQSQSARPAPAAAAPAQGRPAQPAFTGRGDNGRGPGGQFGGQDRAPGNGWQGRPQQPNPAPNQGRPAFQGQLRGDNGGRNDGGQGGYNGGRNDNGQGRNDGGRYDGNQGRGNALGYGRPGGGQWNHGWRQDNRYDWRGWRDQNRDTFHVGRYYAPYRDYSYNRLGIGFFLQPMFFGSDYWIADPYYYRLPPAYGPYHWVRYYNDVVLVNTYNGEVADVIYDFFW